MTIKKKENRELTDLKVIDGGKADRPANDVIIGNRPWIEELEIGDVFWVKDNIPGHPTDYLLQSFEIVAMEYVQEKLVGVLLDTTLNPTDITIPIDPTRFCRRYSLVKVICNTEKSKY
jgi:hypothetical protein